MTATGSVKKYYKKDFWSEENPKYRAPHYRLEKSARIVNKVAGDTECRFLDVGCGPATLSKFLRPSIDYYGIDISIPEPAPNLLELDILENPIDFGGRHFDMVLAQGLFEYLGEHQSEKFSEIAGLLTEGGTFIVSYVNFDHRRRELYPPYNNVQPIADFRESLLRSFTIRRAMPTSYNWCHSEPNRKITRTPNMHFNLNIPYVARFLAVEYFFICSPRTGRR